ncbi:phage tail sheath subtilisin-like domain-containing protein [Magnetospirillum fulvum]|uniref:Phage tail sheath protein n=1 Tax=Magnetospirillum fulvum MGU-K5 TaxID=1316936 RepID=S9S642_MAGFU|nr:phage tail sheath subtilisin-like domain-containing protein [Magnetospirillum fulvum]EPY01382.1 phage tail sheath protein [Magnetospirillum fulvum MGU-K5]
MAETTLSSGAFDEIAADERTSGVKIEVKGVPGYQSDTQSAVIVAQMLAGTAVAGVPMRVEGDGSAAAALFGRGSHSHRMVMAFRRGNSTTPIDVIGLSDNPAGVAATKSILIAGTATAAGQINLYVGLDRVQIGVGIGDTAATLATALAAAINAETNLIVAAQTSATAGEVKITCRHKGEIGNETKLSINLLGDLGGESTPAGIAVTGLGFLTGGSANPDQTAAIAAVQNRDYYYYVLGGWSDTATLSAWSPELEAMWSPERELWGRIGITARRGTLSQLKTFGSARNDRFITCSGVFGTVGPIYETAARLAAKAARSLANHPARPLHELMLTGERAPEKQDIFSARDRKDLLWSGIATVKEGPAQTMVIDRMITLYQRNASGDRDDTWLDITTPATVGLIVNTIKRLVYDRFIATRCILVDDETAEVVDTAIPCTCPKKIKATIFAHYSVLKTAGLVENEAAFRKLFQVGRDPNNPTRINMIYTPDIANPLITFAAQIKFSLQWPSDLVDAA